MSRPTATAWSRNSSTGTARAAGTPRPGCRGPTSRSRDRCRTRGLRPRRSESVRPTHYRFRRRCRAPARSRASDKGRHAASTRQATSSAPSDAGISAPTRRCSRPARDSRSAPICSWAAAGCRAGTGGRCWWRGAPRCRSRCSRRCEPARRTAHPTAPRDSSPDRAPAPTRAAARATARGAMRTMPKARVPSTRSACRLRPPSAQQRHRPERRRLRPTPRDRRSDRRRRRRRASVPVIRAAGRRRRAGSGSESRCPRHWRTRASFAVRRHAFRSERSSDSSVRSDSPSDRAPRRQRTAIS